MAKRLDWRRAKHGVKGKGFSGSTVELTRGPTMGLYGKIGGPGHNLPLRTGQKNSLKSRIIGAQATSATYRKKIGVQPSMPDFGLDKDDPAVVAAQMSREDRLKTIAMDHVDGNLADIIMEQNGYALVRVTMAKGKAKTVCVEIETGKVEWVEAE